MAKRKTARYRSTKQRAARQTQTRRSTANAVSSQAMGELPYEREYANAANRNMDEVTRYVRRNNYSKMLEDTANFARQNMAATFGLGVAAGLVTTQLARRWSAILRKG